MTLYFSKKKNFFYSIDKKNYFEHGPDDSFTAGRSCQRAVVSIKVLEI